MWLCVVLNHPHLYMCWLCVFVFAILFATPPTTYNCAIRCVLCAPFSLVQLSSASIPRLLFEHHLLAVSSFKVFDCYIFSCYKQSLGFCYPTAVTLLLFELVWMINYFIVVGLPCFQHWLNGSTVSGLCERKIRRRNPCSKTAHRSLFG